MSGVYPYDYGSFSPYGAYGGYGGDLFFGAFLVFFVVIMLIVLLIGVVQYIFMSLGLQRIAKRRGIRHPWLVWLPVGTQWILGSVSDQYQYVVKGKIKRRRIILLILAVLAVPLGIVYAFTSAALQPQILSLILGAAYETQANLVFSALAVLVTTLVINTLSIAQTVFYYISLYDLYRSCNPQNAVLFLVLSILFPVTMPFFVFACREKDGGMPPRKEDPLASPPVLPVQNPGMPAGYRVGLSTNGKQIGPELFAEYRRAGIEFAEISTDQEAYPYLDYARIARDAAAAGVTLWSFHLPFAPFDRIDISALDEGLRTGSIAYWKQIMEQATAVGIRRFIVHPSGEPIADGERPARMLAAKRSLAQLAQIAADLGAVIAVENLPRTCLGRDAAEILELVGVDERLKVCFDTNHLLTQSPGEFVYRVGKKIVTTHVSDYDLLDEKHWLPGEGGCDWSALLRALRDVGYGGVWLYEVAFQPPQTRYRSRDLTCMDFRRNADELFAGRTPTVVE